MSDELTNKQLEIIEGLEKAAKELKEKATDAEYEAYEMSEHADEIEEIADNLRQGYHEDAIDIASDISFSQYNICHLDMYNLKDTIKFLDGIEQEIEAEFPIPEDEEEEEEEE